MTAEKLRIYGIWISVESGRIMKVLKAWGRPVAEMYGNGTVNTLVYRRSRTGPLAGTFLGLGHV